MMRFLEFLSVCWRLLMWEWLFSVPNVDSLVCPHGTTYGIFVFLCGACASPVFEVDRLVCPTTVGHSWS